MVLSASKLSGLCDTTAYLGERRGRLQLLRDVHALDDLVWVARVVHLEDRAARSRFLDLVSDAKEVFDLERARLRVTVSR